MGSLRVKKTLTFALTHKGQLVTVDIPALFDCVLVDWLGLTLAEPCVGTFPSSRGEGRQRKGAAATGT